MFMKNDKLMDDEEEPISGGFNEVYEFFTKYVRRIHPYTYWKKNMNMCPNVFWFQLVTPSNIAFVILLLQNGSPVWNKKKTLFKTEESGRKEARPLFTAGEEKKMSFGGTTWSKKGLKYFHTVEKTCWEAYRNKEQMSVLVNGQERWEPNDDTGKGRRC
jgi:hypothetical protein